MQAAADPKEVHKFNHIARSYWDLEGPMRALHQMNPLRIDFTETLQPLHGARVLDVGCGGGLASEAMARRGAEVTAIDASPEMLNTARLHALESELVIDYRQVTAEDLQTTHAGYFDLVTCFEMIEHVPDPSATLAALATLVKPGGHAVISTINRTPKAYLGAVVAAEYVLNWVPKGTHDYQRFLKPSEIAAMLRTSSCDLVALEGVVFQPLYQQFKRDLNDFGINYQLAARKADHESH